MIWLVAGILYSAAYAAAMVATDAHPLARAWVSNLGLFVSPAAVIVVVFTRRRLWIGRQRLFWFTIAGGAAMWLVGAIGWSVHALAFPGGAPWLDWHTLLQLGGAMLFLLALAARPDRGPQPESTLSAGLDVAGLAFLGVFLYWALVVVPGIASAREIEAALALAWIGISIRIAAAVGYGVSAARLGRHAWRHAYDRLALAAMVAAVLLIVNALALRDGTYRGGGLGDLGWILPFWICAWAAAESPASEPALPHPIAAGDRPGFPALLFIALAIVALVGYATPRLFAPGERTGIAATHDLGTLVTLLGGIVLVMIRVRLEQRKTQLADRRVRLLAGAIEQATELVVLVRRNTIEYANDAFCRATGYGRTELARVPADRLVGAAWPPATTPIAAVREGVRERCVIERRDGTTFHAECAFAPLDAEDGGVPYFVGVIRDLTDENRMREQVVRSERLSAVGELAAGIAHELNNPLQSVVGTVDVISLNPASAPLLADLDRVRVEATRAGRIVKNLLAFVRRSPKDRVLGDLNEIVRATVALRAYELETSNVTLRESYAPNLPLVLANREDIQQILINLILNAEAAMKSARPRGVLTVRTALAGTAAVVEIEDDGPGVPRESAARIFEPFFTTRDVDREATGLGLSIAFGLATAHGGTLELVPTPIGACFRLTLPGAGFPGPVHIH